MNDVAASANFLGKTIGNRDHSQRHQRQGAPRRCGRRHRQERRRQDHAAGDAAGPVTAHQRQQHRAGRRQPAPVGGGEGAHRLRAPAGRTDCGADRPAPAGPDRFVLPQLGQGTDRAPGDRMGSAAGPAHAHALRRRAAETLDADGAGQSPRPAGARRTRRQPRSGGAAQVPAAGAGNCLRQFACSDLLHAHRLGPGARGQPHLDTQGRPADLGWRHRCAQGVGGAAAHSCARSACPTSRCPAACHCAAVRMD